MNTLRPAQEMITQLCRLLRQAYLNNLGQAFWDILLFSQCSIFCMYVSHSKLFFFLCNIGNHLQVRIQIHNLNETDLQFVLEVFSILRGISHCYVQDIPRGYNGRAFQTYSNNVDIYEHEKRSISKIVMYIRCLKFAQNFQPITYIQGFGAGWKSPNPAPAPSFKKIRLPA